MKTALADIRYSLRMLRKSPVFTTVTVLTLVLGIGANTAIFSVIDARFLQPLEFAQPDQLLDVNATCLQRGLTPAGLTLPEYLEWKQQTTSLQAMAFYTFAAFTYTQAAGANFFSVLRESRCSGDSLALTKIELAGMT